MNRIVKLFSAIVVCGTLSSCCCATKERVDALEAELMNVKKNSEACCAENKAAINSMMNKNFKKSMQK